MQKYCGIPSGVGMSIAAVMLNSLPAHGAVVAPDAAAALIPFSYPVLLVVITIAAVAFAVVAGYLARVGAGRAGAQTEAFEEIIHELEAKLLRSDSILGAQPDAVFVWNREGVGRQRSAPQVMGSTAGLINPATGKVDFDYVLSRFDRVHAGRLRSAAERLRERGARFSLQLNTRDDRTFEAEGRPAGAQAVVWVRDVSGERKEITLLAQELEDAGIARESFQSLLDAAPFPVWRRAQDFSLEWVNSAYAEAVEGGSTERVVNEGIELLGEDARVASEAAFNESGPTVHQHYSVIGNERRALKVLDLKLPDGAMAGVALDVSELDAVEQGLDEHIRAHNETLDKLATAVAIFGPDKALRFANRAYAALWKFDSEWLAEGPSDGEILERLRDRRLLPEQADFPNWKRKRLDLYTQVEPSEDLWHLPNGQTLRVVAQPHPFGGTVQLFENVTDQIQLESSYNTLVGVQRETLDNLHEGVAVFGSDGLLKLFNPAYAKLWRLNAAQLTGEPHIEEVTGWSKDLFSSEDERAGIIERVTSLASERRSAVGRMERPDGSILDYAMVPLPDGATLLTYVDVSAATRIERALRERNEALETADRLKSEFISHVSYQLRTPLTNIVGFGEILESEMFGSLSDKQHEYTSGLLESSQQLLNLINDIIDLATIEAGAMTLDLGDVDIGQLVERSVDLMISRARADDVQLTANFDSDLGVFRADARRLRQIIFNLLSNALAYTSPGDEVEVGVRRGVGEVRLWVRDTGVGIAPAEQANVFDRFEVHGRRQGRGQRGAGLGLSLVKSFVELHGGWVTLESVPDQGTTVTCHLPDRVHEPAQTVDMAVPSAGLGLAPPVDEKATTSETAT